MTWSSCGSEFQFNTECAPSQMLIQCFLLFSCRARMMSSGSRVCHVLAQLGKQRLTPFTELEEQKRLTYCESVYAAHLFVRPTMTFFFLKQAKHQRHPHAGTTHLCVFSGGHG